MVKEDYISFETAKLLKEKGFDGEWHKHYWGYFPGIEFLTEGSFNPEYDYPAPTIQMAMKWLREEKKIGIEVNIIFDLDDDHKWYYEYGFCIFQLSGTYKKIAECDYDGYKTYEEACEAAIKYSLENLI